MAIILPPGSGNTMPCNKNLGKVAVALRCYRDAVGAGEGQSDCGERRCAVWHGIHDQWCFADFLKNSTGFPIRRRNPRTSAFKCHLCPLLIQSRTNYRRWRGTYAALHTQRKRSVARRQLPVHIIGLRAEVGSGKLPIMHRGTVSTAVHSPGLTEMHYEMNWPESRLSGANSFDRPCHCAVRATIWSGAYSWSEVPRSGCPI
jgi:hypothetical protein